MKTKENTTRTIQGLGTFEPQDTYAFMDLYRILNEALSESGRKYTMSRFRYDYEASNIAQYKEAYRLTGTLRKKYWQATPFAQEHGYAQTVTHSFLDRGFLRKHPQCRVSIDGLELLFKFAQQSLPEGSVHFFDPDDRERMIQLVRGGADVVHYINGEAFDVELFGSKRLVAVKEL